MLKSLLRRPTAQRLIAWALANYLDFALRTTRWTIHGAEHLTPYVNGDPAIFAFWHERLPLMPALFRQTQRSHPAIRAAVLVSRHNDGQIIGNIIQHFGVDVVHGSTQRNGRDRGGAAGFRALLDVLNARKFAVITPDGPRGPRRTAAPGVAELAARAGVPILPCAAQTRRRHTLATWDRMILPLPWSRGVLVVTPPLHAPDLPSVTAALSQACDTADTLCP